MYILDNNFKEKAYINDEICSVTIDLLNVINYKNGLQRGIKFLIQSYFLIQ